MDVNSLALTFDDGPDGRWTARLLDALGRAGARATFFPIAPRAAARRDLMARILSEGHAVGLHCDEHVRHSHRDAASGRADTERALARLHAVGVTLRLWRTPGATPRRGRPRSRRSTAFGWSAGPSTPTTGAATAPQTCSPPSARACAAAIVLAHDGIGPGARRADARETVQFVELVARHADAHGLALTAL